MRTFAIIPVRGEWRLTSRALGCLAMEPVEDVLVLDNGSPDDTASRIRSLQRYREWSGRLHRTDTTGLTIYEAWNLGFARAKQLARRGPFEVLVLNNDVELPRGAVGLLRNALLSQRHERVWVTYPDYDAAWIDDAREAWCELRATRGVFGDGGMFGPCFCLAGDAIPWTPLITDLAYEWWWGDNHLAECVAQEGGTQLRVVGLPVRHEGEATARHYPELDRAKLRDRGRWLTREARGSRAINRGGAP